MISVRRPFGPFVRLFAASSVLSVAVPPVLTEGTETEKFRSFAGGMDRLLSASGATAQGPSSSRGGASRRQTSTDNKNVL